MMQEAEITSIAKEYMGHRSLPIAIFAFTVIAVYAFSFYAGVTGMWPLWVSFLVSSYLAFM